MTGAVEYDVVIVGAGISGIDAAYHLNQRHPDLSYAVLENKSEIGGTWHTHRFPGIRSDSDLFTFGFAWKPWTGVPIATAPEILKYLNAAVDEQGIREKIQFNQSIISASWCSSAQVWTLLVDTSEGQREVRCRFLWSCAGYYDHGQGYLPEWENADGFEGALVHAQTWPEDLVTDGKRVVVIGSGATAATILPALAGKVAHLTMLQRSPTYYMARPQMDDFTKTLSALDLPQEWYHEIMRRRYLYESKTFVERTRTEPEVVAQEMIATAQEYLGEGYDVKTHFTPSYKPWKQRVAMIPEGDLFVAIRDGLVDVVTDGVERFSKDGIVLTSGRVLKADVVVAATGLNLRMFGSIKIDVDGQGIDPASTFTHRGVMFTGLPNLVNVFGYFRTSWTMRAGLVSDYVCRLFDHMKARGVHVVVPQLRAQDADMPAVPWIDAEDFSAGYVKRNLDMMPRMGDKQPWIMTQNYHVDRYDLPDADLEDGTLIYSALHPENR